MTNSTHSYERRLWLLDEVWRFPKIFFLSPFEFISRYLLACSHTLWNQWTACIDVDLPMMLNALFEAWSLSRSPCNLQFHYFRKNRRLAINLLVQRKTTCVFVAFFSNVSYYCREIIMKKTSLKTVICYLSAITLKPRLKCTKKNLFSSTSH